MPIRDTRLLARALMQRWPITPEMRKGIVGSLIKVLADPNASPREKTSAAKALMAAEKQNQDDEHKVIDVEVQHSRDKLAQIARELGIDEGVVLDVEARRIGSAEDISDAGQQDRSGQGH